MIERENLIKSLDSMKNNLTKVSGTLNEEFDEIDCVIKDMKKDDDKFNLEFIPKLQFLQYKIYDVVKTISIIKDADLEIIESINEYNKGDTNSVAKKLEETLKREKEMRKIVRHNLLKFVSDLIDNSDCDTIFDTDGDQKEVFVRTTDDRLFIIDKYLLGHIIYVLLEIADTHIIKDESNNAIYAYFIYNGNIFEVGRVVGQGTYEYFRRVVDINEKDDYIKILNLKKIYDYYKENINYD